MNNAHLDSKANRNKWRNELLIFLSLKCWNFLLLRLRLRTLSLVKLIPTSSSFYRTPSRNSYRFFSFCLYDDK